MRPAGILYNFQERQNMDQEKRCQIHCVDSMSEPLHPAEVIAQRRNRLKRIVKRRLEYLRNWFDELKRMRRMEKTASPLLKIDLKPGDLVRVRSSEEIKQALNRWNQLRGCSFMEEMWPYCGTTQRVFKRVEKFLDERDYLMKKCKGIVILEGVMCEGTKDFGACDRSCFFFWREEWLEKID